MSEREPEPPWWKSGPGTNVIAGAIGAIALVVAAVITGVFGLLDNNTSSPTAAPSSIPTSTSVPAPTLSSTSESPTTAQSSTPPVRRHEKLVVMASRADDSSFKDLDALNREWQSGSEEIILDTFFLVAKETTWISSRKQADYQACSDKSKIVRTIDYLYPNDARANTNLCVETNEGRLALLHIDRIAASGDEFNFIAFTATVWEKESP